MNHRLSALLLVGALLLSPNGFSPALAETVPLTPSMVIDAATYSAPGDLQIDNGQNVVIDFSNAPNGLQIGGNLVNNGNLFAVSTSGQALASFFASNITNNQSALFTTVLPQAGITGYQNAITGLS